MIFIAFKAQKITRRKQGAKFQVAKL